MTILELESTDSDSSRRLARSGVTTDPADPAMRGARGLYGGPKNYAINFFTENFTEQLSCGRALR